MEEYIVNTRDVGLRVDQFLKVKLSYVPSSLIYKTIRKKDVKVNGVRINLEKKLSLNDQVQMYISNSRLLDLKKQYYKSPIEFDVVYEDENLLLVDKKRGILCHSDKINVDKTLIERVNEYLIYNDKNYHYNPQLCNRIDRNTGGIVIIAKTPKAKSIIDEKILNNEIEKYYFCIVDGIPQAKRGIIENQIFKDSKKSMSYISEVKTKKTRTAITDYKVVAHKDNISLLECRLITGRTHQIRAQLAYMGYPIIGDNKYGRKSLNKLFLEKKQLLFSAKIKFRFSTNSGELSYLNNRTFSISRINLIEKYFPKYVRNF